MKFLYRQYEPGKGLEELQAQIYNSAVKDLPNSTPASAEQILQRYKSENTDPKGVRYALKEDGSPLAYVQTRVTTSPDREKTTWIGYPWAMPDCLPEVQEKLWAETFEYVKNRALEEMEEAKFIIGYFNEAWEKQITFAKEKGFEEEDRGYQYGLDVRKASKVDHPGYSARIADENDLTALVELCNADPALRGAFPNEDAWVSYFKDKVLPDGNTILLFNDEGRLICAGAPLHGFLENGVIVRFSAALPSYESAWKTLLVQISKRCVDQGWEDLPLLFFADTERERAAIAEELGAKVRTTSIGFSKTIKRS
ncbi:MAG: hypothetical protein ACFFGZ_19425 [Candidatus Thorarchaeota archaeon]